MTMVDTSNRMPSGGFLLPCIPAEYLDDPTNEAARLTPLDAQLEGVRQSQDAVLDRHDVRVAQGADLDLIGDFEGVPRLAGEIDDVYRQRIPATCQNGIGATTRPLMQALLEGATGVPVVAQNAQNRPGRFQIIFHAPPPQGAAVVGLIQQSKALGMDFGAYVIDTTQQVGRLGTFRLGEQALGGGQSYITLHRPIVVALGGATARLGSFRVGEQRLAGGTAVIW